MKKIIVIALAAALALTAFASCGKKETSSVSTDGSTSMSKVISALGEAFQEKNGIAFTYNATGSGSGITAVSEGRCDIGLSSRALKDEEKAKGLEGTVLAYDGIAIVVNPENPVNGLDLETVASIYTGEITNWKDVGGNDAEIVTSDARREAARETASNPSQRRKASAGTVRSSPPPEMLLPR